MALIIFKVRPVKIILKLAIVNFKTEQNILCEKYIMKLFLVNLLVGGLASILIIQTAPASKNNNYLKSLSDNQLQQVKNQKSDRQKQLDREIESYQELMDTDNASSLFVFE